MRLKNFTFLLSILPVAFIMACQDSVFSASDNNSKNNGSALQDTARDSLVNPDSNTAIIPSDSTGFLDSNFTITPVDSSVITPEVVSGQ